MDKLNTIIENSFIYRLIEWICRLSQESIMFKVNVISFYREKKSVFDNTLLSKWMAMIGSWISEKVKSSWFFEIISSTTRFMYKNSLIIRVISRINWLYFLPFFVWIDRILRAMNIPYSGYWDELYLLFLIAIIAYRRWVKDIKLFISNIDFAIALFVLSYGIIMIVNSSDIIVGIEGFRVVCQYLVTYFIVVQLTSTKEQVRTLLWLFLISIGLLGLHGCYQFVAGVEIPAAWVDSGEDVRTRAFSILGSPNALASILVMFLPVAFSMFIAEKKILSKLVALGITLIIGMGMLFTMSRGAWIAAMVAIVLFLFLVGKRLIFSVIAMGTLAVFGINQIWSRVYYLLTPEYMAKSATGGRLYRYEESLEIWAQGSKWFGLGVGRFGGATATNHGLSPFYMDSFYLKTLVEAGYLGILAYGGLILFTLLQSFRYIFATRNVYSRIVMYGIVSGMTGVLLHNAVENIFEIPYMVTYFWVLVAVIVAYYRVDTKKTMKVTQ